MDLDDIWQVRLWELKTHFVRWPPGERKICESKPQPKHAVASDLRRLFIVH